MSNFFRISLAVMAFLLVACMTLQATIGDIPSPVVSLVFLMAFITIVLAVFAQRRETAVTCC